MKTKRLVTVAFLSALLGSVIGPLFWGWGATYDPTQPVGTDPPSDIDNEIRRTKESSQERLDIDHYWPLVGGLADGTDVGKHRYITFQGPNSISTVNADEYILFTKDVSAIAELHGRDESENEFQITSAGTLNITSADLVGTLANATYFTAVDAAGSSTVNLIKADANDVAVVPDNSQTATSAAPTSTTGIANKKYVDDQDNTSADAMHDAEGGYNNVDVDGTKTKVYTKYLIGTLDADSETSIAHGISGVDNILSVIVSIYNSNLSKYTVTDYWNSYRGGNTNDMWWIRYDGTNVIIGEVGSRSQGQKYRIKIDYIL